MSLKRAKMSGGHSKSVQLTAGSPVLYEISQFFNEASTYALAAILLENKLPGGGFAFLQRNISAFAMPNWSIMAFRVLSEWCDKCLEIPCGADLYMVLSKILPAVAVQFCDVLLGPDEHKEMTLEEELQETSRESLNVISQKRMAISRHGVIITVGNPGAGKTSFIRAVMGEDFCKDMDSTKGISVTSSEANLTGEAQQKGAMFKQTDPDGALVQAITDQLKKKSSKPSPLLHREEANTDQDAVSAVYSQEEVIPDREQVLAEERSVLYLSEESVRKIHNYEEQLKEGMTKTFVRFVDCGGQLSYLSTQTMCFGTKNTLYVLAFDASRWSQEVDQETFRQGHRSTHTDARVQVSHIDYVMHWLNNIAIVSNSDTLTDVFVLLLATHVDEVSEEKTIREVRSAISKRLGKSKLEKKLYILGPYFVDNRTAGSGCSTSEMSNVQVKLREEIDKKFMSKEVPLQFLLLDVILQQMQEKHPVLFVKELTALPEVVAVVDKSQTIVDEVLKYLEDVNRIRFLRKGDEQSAGDNIVCINPDWLVKEITKVMTCSMEELDEVRCGPREDILRLKEEGILTKKLYSKLLWKEHDSNVQQALLQAMEQHGLQAPIDSSKHQGDDNHIPNEHWVPSCLKSDKDKSGQFRDAMECAFMVPPMLIATEDLFLPLPVFTRLVAYLLNRYQPEAKDAVLAFSKVQFDCSSTSSEQKNSFYHARMSYTERGICIAVLCSDEKVALQQTGLPGIVQVAGNFCQQVFEMLTTASGCAKLKFHAEFACPSSPPDKQHWIAPSPPVQLPVTHGISDDKAEALSLGSYRCPLCGKRHKIPDCWLAWFGRLSGQQSQPKHIPRPDHLSSGTEIPSASVPPPVSDLHEEQALDKLQESTAANNATKVSPGKKLDDEDFRTKLFEDISRKSREIDIVYRLADALLKNCVPPVNGRDWVKAKTVSGGVPDVEGNARDVLEYWYHHSRETPHRGKLYFVLCEILPRVAEHWKNHLAED